jgi:hypothetical protein
VPLACNLRPEFEYVGSAPRKLGLALAFVVAGASGIAVFMADSDPDPMNAMALGPVEALSSVVNATPAGTARTQAAGAAFAQKPTEAGGNKSPCQENATEKLSSDCTPGKAYTPRSVQAVSERPAIAAVPIGRDGPALLSSERATPVAATPDGPDGFAKQADAGPAMDAAPASAVVESPTRAASVEKARTRSSQVHRRDRNGYSSSPRYRSHSYYQSGYARVY